MNNPCAKDCPDRSPTCHAKGNCKHGFDEYAEYREQIRQAKAKNQIISRYISDEIKKRVRRKEKR